MKVGKTLQELVVEVQRQSRAKRDVLANTFDQVLMQQFTGEADFGPAGVALVTLDGDKIDRFGITDHAHGQIAGWLNIPQKYYDRLLSDHPDLVIHQVNELFRREPARRMLRILDGKVRAFLSDRYRRVDNDLVLAKTLPALMAADGSMPANKVLGSHINENDMKLRVVWTDPALEQTIGTAPNGGPDTVRPGFEMGNSETGRGKFKVRGFFYRSYCDNGCIFGIGDADLQFEQLHVGGKLSAGADMAVISDETQRKNDEALIATVTDVLRALGNPSFVNQMGDALRALKTGEQIQQPTKAIEVLGKTVGLLERELDDVLTNLIKDQDFSRWGAVNAVTAVANKDETSEDRALELQDIGAQIIAMPVNVWDNIAHARVPVARAA